MSIAENIYGHERSITKNCKDLIVASRKAKGDLMHKFFVPPCYVRLKDIDRDMGSEYLCVTSVYFSRVHFCDNDFELCASGFGFSIFS